MKSSKRNPAVYLEDILSAIAKIEEYTKEGKRSFFADGKTQDAVIRQISIIGEASARLPTALKMRHTNIPWKDIVAMRNIIIHDYSKTDLTTVWDTVRYGLPPLRKTVTTMLRERREIEA
jgi:uncharacterized protein with HEPN domain